MIIQFATVNELNTDNEHIVMLDNPIQIDVLSWYRAVEYGAIVLTTTYKENYGWQLLIGRHKGIYTIENLDYDDDYVQQIIRHFNLES